MFLESRTPSVPDSPSTSEDDRGRFLDCSALNRMDRHSHDLVKPHNPKGPTSDHAWSLRACVQRGSGNDAFKDTHVTEPLRFAAIGA